MNNKILAMCVVALMAVGGIGVLAAKPLSGVTNAQVLVRGNVPVYDIGVDNIGYEIWTGTGREAAVVQVKISYDADIPSGTYLAISFRTTGTPGTELGYYAGVTTGTISAATTTTFALYNWMDEHWTGTGGSYTYQFPPVQDVDHLIVTVAGNSNYVTS